MPGHSYSFGVVKAAQAGGDLAVLVDRGRRALRVHIKNVDAGLAKLAQAKDEALERRFRHLQGVLRCKIGMIGLAKWVATCPAA